MPELKNMPVGRTPNSSYPILVYPVGMLQPVSTVEYMKRLSDSQSILRIL